MTASHKYALFYVSKVAASYVRLNRKALRKMAIVELLRERQELEPNSFVILT